VCHAQGHTSNPPLLLHAAVMNTIVIDNDLALLEPAYWQKDELGRPSAPFCTTTTTPLQAVGLHSRSALPCSTPPLLLAVTRLVDEVSSGQAEDWDKVGGW
jgi:hypothetical protein